MHTLTAFYSTRAEAEAAQNQLRLLGIIGADSVQIAGQDSPGFAAARDGDNQGFWSSLKHLFLPADDRDVYEQGIREGGYLLTVNCEEQSADRVHTLLEATNAVDINERENVYRQQGVLSAKPRGGDTETLPVTQEKLHVGKRQVDRGGVRVRSYVVEKPVSEQVNLREENVRVERRAVDRPVGADSELFRDRTVEMTATTEEPVIAKDARVVEEVVVHKDVRQRSEQIKDTVKRTEVKVDDLGKNPRRNLIPED